MFTCGRAEASHNLVRKLDKLESCRGYQVIYSIGWALAEPDEPPGPSP